MPDEFKAARTAALARYDQLLAEFKDECKAEGDKIRALGGLYVLGTERHESRRIDNQLRGRSGRQGDPGESRFYLSLDDELMRLFATGALSWVMGRALPDDEAIEAKMVTKAIERAQTTVEQRNGEIRKNVLKYDEVMNEQRKVIYKRRDQILEGVDLKTAAMEYLAEAVNSLIETHCASVATDEWDLDGLVLELKTFWPSDITEAQLEECHETDEMYDLVMSDASAYYEKREAELTRRRHARRRAPGDAAHHRPALARAPRGDGLPAGGHQPPGHRPEGPARRVAARGLRDVRQPDEGHRPGLRQVRHARPGHPQRCAGARPCRTCSRPRATTCSPMASRPLRRPRLRPARSTRQLPRSCRARTGQAADDRQGRVVEDSAQRAVPVRQRQEVQDVPRRA